MSDAAWIRVGHALEAMPDLLLAVFPNPVWIWLTDRLQAAVERTVS